MASEQARDGADNGGERSRGLQEDPCVYVITFPTPYGCPRSQQLSKGWVFVIWCADRRRDARPTP